MNNTYIARYSWPYNGIFKSSERTTKAGAHAELALKMRSELPRHLLSAVDVVYEVYTCGRHTRTEDFFGHRIS